MKIGELAQAAPCSVETVRYYETEPLLAEPQRSAGNYRQYGVPHVADMAAPWQSEVRAALAGRTEELERVAIEMYARGLSVRDIEAALE